MKDWGWGEKKGKERRKMQHKRTKKKQNSKNRNIGMEQIRNAKNSIENENNKRREAEGKGKVRKGEKCNIIGQRKRQNSKDRSIGVELNGNAETVLKMKIMKDVTVRQEEGHEKEKNTMELGGRRNKILKKETHIGMVQMENIDAGTNNKNNERDVRVRREQRHGEEANTIQVRMKRRKE